MYKLYFRIIIDYLKDLPTQLRIAGLHHINTEYIDFIKIYIDGFVDLCNKAIAGYYCHELGERDFIPCDPMTSIISELLVINAALMLCSTLLLVQICFFMYGFQIHSASNTDLTIIQQKLLFPVGDIKENEEADTIARLVSHLFPTPPMQRSLKICKSFWKRGLI